MFNKHYIPAAGMTVIDPADKKPLPPEGKTVKGNQTYWLRREAEQPPVFADAPPAKPGKAK